MGIEAGTKVKYVPDREFWADRARDRELTRRGHLAQAHPRVAAIERQVATMRTGSTDHVFFDAVGIPSIFQPPPSALYRPTMASSRASLIWPTESRAE